MKIINFKGKRVFGHLDFDVNFNDDLSFLYGDNGSGKTTALKLVKSLLKPDLSELIMLKFEYIETTIKFEGRKTRVVCEKDVEKIEIKIIDYLSKKVLTISNILNKSKHHYSSEFIGDYSKDIYRNNRDHPVLKFLTNFDNIQFIGLDRAYQYAPKTMKNSYRYYEKEKKVYNLSVVSRYIRDEYLDAKHLVQETLSSFRKEIIRSLFDDSTDFEISSSEVKKQLEEIVNQKTQVLNATKILEDDVLTRKINNHFDAIEKLLKKIKKQPDPADADLDTLLEIFNRADQIKRISSLANIATRYNKKTEKIMFKFNRFVSTINDFYKSSKKRIDIDHQGFVEVIHNDSYTTGIDVLSSGERQVFMILASVIFDDSRKILIIDEPELSLHISWQENFVDIIKELCPKMQIILATHSPDLIGIHLNKVVKLNG